MITLIAARSRNGVIGIDGQLPWHLPSDLKQFKTLTEGNTVVMGRKTFESIGFALPNRQNIVVSRDRNFCPDGVETVRTLEAAIWVNRTTNIFIIGGAQIYQEALDKSLIDRMVITIVNLFIEPKPSQTLTYFPDIDPEMWQVAKASKTVDEMRGIELAIVEYEKSSTENIYSPLVYLPASRYSEQTQKMEQILQDGLCPFCSVWLDWYHDSPILFTSNHWLVTPNDNPYTGTALDLLIISLEHVTSFEKLSKSAQREFGRVIARIIEEFNLDFGAVGMRFGQMIYTASSVAHLHAHLKVGDVENPDFTPIRFKMSSKPQKTPPTIS